MGTNKNEVEVADVATAPIASDPTMSIDEFCARLSETVVRPELIGAFAYSERVAGNLRGSAEQFKVRYTAFINKPV